MRTRRYGEDRLHLLVRDPHHVVAIWEISPALATLAAARARSRGAVPRYRVNIERRAREDAPAALATGADLPDALGGERWRLDLPESGGQARAVLGLDFPTGFEPLLVSRWADVPPDAPCRELGPWSLDADAAAWLDREARRARGGSAPMPSSSSRYLDPGPRKP